jgi:hypothetical protein
MGHPRIAQCVVSHGRRARLFDRCHELWLDSLIVVMNCGRMWGLGGPTCVVLLGCPLQGVY